MQGMEEAGARLAQNLTGKVGQDEGFYGSRYSVAWVSGGLYFITAADKSARDAMLASWVAQARFEPLTLTFDGGFCQRL